MNKPNFSYYPSMNGIYENVIDDEKVKLFPKEKLLIEIDEEVFDAEIIF